MQSASCLSLKWDITVLELQSGTLVIYELLATIQPVCELQAAVKESASVCIISSLHFQSTLFQVCMLNNVKVTT